MFRQLNDFLRTWEFETEATLRIFGALSDESLKKEVTSQDRTVGRIAWHMVESIPFLMSQTGIQLEAPNNNGVVPSSVQVIADSFRVVKEELAKQLQTKWTDDDLTKFNDIFGMKLPNGTTLYTLLQHQTHHRGQITVLMRQAGLKVPGVYGPAKEEWSNMGLEAPKI